MIINFKMHLICTLMETIRGHLATCLATMTVQNKVTIIIIVTLLPTSSLARLQGGS